MIAVEALQDGGGGRGDGRRARDVAEESDLADEIARPERGDVAAVFRHFDLAGFDDVETVAPVALANHDLAGPGGDGHEPAREPFERLFREEREERDAA